MKRCKHTDVRTLQFALKYPAMTLFFDEGTFVVIFDCEYLNQCPQCGINVAVPFDPQQPYPKTDGGLIDELTLCHQAQGAG